MAIDHDLVAEAPEPEDRHQANHVQRQLSIGEP